ncbi:MAG: hypothetical protein DSM107014_00375 [Gomphosphaeria aponina SAG 52.96 = DSM 107014]|uniref:Uncharacterized protein n=1 Tax=Gomphosphaeria aponina SAG 52.96 = DSM 107014 TaxID=1521640 RepID=A0A941GMU0_9CHRO|nr:hypothetical protein [Gomphosphaeria aponina SAG 52.96 = DSM 107014]
MNQNAHQPRPGDVVLGNQLPQPINAAVLGGLAGVKQRLKLVSDGDETIMYLLLEALNYGAAGEDFVFHFLTTSSGRIGLKAYDLLWRWGDLATKQEMVKYFCGMAEEIELVII